MEIALFLLPLLIVIILFYNNIIRKRNQIDNAFSAIDVMLKKRFDLLPNLVDTIRHYTQYEQGTLTKITELRNQALQTGNSVDRANLDAQLAGSVKGLIAQVENYPELKANASYLHLQRSWSESEEQIAAARRTYNSNVTTYNDAIMTFPGNVLASVFSFKAKTVLETPSEERETFRARDLFNS